MKAKIGNILKIGFTGFLLMGLLILSSDLYVSSFQKYTETDINKVEDFKVGLVLGTSKYTSQGRINLFYKYRLQAATELYNSGKICKILVSGDNGNYSYNEPRMMFQDLVDAGIPSSDIFLDYAGFRTFDSVIRANKVFNQTSFLIISQQFHNERAVFIAKKNGINAKAYNAKGVSFKFSPKTVIREKLARVKAVLDVHLLGTSPKFLGKKEVIS